jgi:hypothetical protein
MGFTENAEYTMVWHRTEMVSCVSAVTSWETIRCFMERECEQLPFIDPVEKYKLNNKELREQLDTTDYVLHVLLPEVFQGGAIPAYLARWVEKLSIKSLPGSVREWSAPLPAEQWRAPSNELIEASNATLEAYRKLQDSDAPTSFRNNRLQDLF